MLKTTELPLLSYFLLKVNLSAIEQWLPSQVKTNPCPTNDWKNPKTKEYKITILPTDPFTFYHNQANEFSPSIGGLDILNNENIGCIEWAWTQSFFYVNVSEPRVPIFSVPIGEIFHLLKTGKNLSEKALRDKDTISLDIDEKFNEIYRNRSSRFGITYSNELVSLSVVCASADDLVNY